jgi:hypothetical protein
LNHRCHPRVSFPTKTIELDRELPAGENEDGELSHPNTKVTNLKRFDVPLAILLILILSGCQSISGPKNSQSTLLVGKAIFKAVAVTDNEPMNGVSTSDIHLYFEGGKNNTTFEAVTNNDGMFFLEGLEPGIYHLKKIQIKLMRGKFSSFSTTLNHEKSIEVGPGVISNVGIIDWFTDPNPDYPTKYFADVFSNRDFDLVKDIVQSLPSFTPWATFPWKNISTGADYN